MKKILGIDPGLERMGLGLICITNDQNDAKIPQYLHHTVIKTKPKAKLQDRLLLLLDQLKLFIDEHKPDVLIIEEIFAGINRNTIIKLSMARTIPILCASMYKNDLIHLPTRLIKQYITGLGSAEKDIVAKQVCHLLNIKYIDNLDATDALACALCYLYL